MEIVNLGHASFLLKGKSVSVVVDPYRDNSVPNLTFPRVHANYVLKSHDHYDHDAVNLVSIDKTDDNLKYETIVVPHDHHNGQHRGLNKIHIFYIDGYKIVHTGDLGCIPDESVLNKLKEADILLAPINGHFTISAQELHDICQIIKPRLVIPMHYYNKANNSGYPDSGQIDVFKRLVGSYYEVNEYKIEISDEILNKKVLIFNKALQEDI